MKSWDRVSFTMEEKPARRYALLAAAFAGALMIAVGGWLLTRSLSERNPEKLFAVYFEYPPLPGSLSRGEDDADSVKFEAFSLYREKDYASAASILNEYIHAQDDTLAKFYLGALLVGGKSLEPEGITLLRESVSSPQVDESEVYWYLSLGYLREGKIDSCLNELEKLTAKENAFQTKAVKLKKSVLKIQ